MDANVPRIFEGNFAILESSLRTFERKFAVVVSVLIQTLSEIQYVICNNAMQKTFEISIVNLIDLTCLNLKECLIGDVILTARSIRVSVHTCCYDHTSTPRK